MDNNLFSGLANFNDYKSNWWTSSFKILEKVQKDFLKAEPHPKDYIWPRDALHNFIRSWEYPYVYHNILSLLKNKKKAKVLDLGSGITFFPYALLGADFSVVALDNDPKTKIGLEKANSKLAKKYGKLEFVEADAKKMPFGNSNFDLVYCISVLEHIPQNHQVVKELSRVLKKGGICILTFDINLNDNQIGLDSKKLLKLRNEIEKYFVQYSQERTVHPLDLISTTQTKYPLFQETQLKLFFKNIKRSLLKKEKAENYDLTTFALVLKKK